MVQIEKRILVVNENIAFCQAFQDRIQNSCTAVICTQSEITALDIFIKQEWCLVVLDIHPSDQTRMEMLRVMHSTKRILILALIPLLEKDEKIAVFRAGADVCLDKATDMEICVAQANALIEIYLESNTEQNTRDIIAFGTELIISPKCRQIIVDGEPLALTRKEFDLLHYLAHNQRQVFSRRQLYEQVWPDGIVDGGEETVRVHLNTLRKKLLSANKDLIQNVWGVGYYFIPPQAET